MQALRNERKGLWDVWVTGAVLLPNRSTLTPTFVLIVPKIFENMKVHIISSLTLNDLELDDMIGSLHAKINDIDLPVALPVPASKGEGFWY